jgi:hypothetical protein
MVQEVVGCSVAAKSQGAKSLVILVCWWLKRKDFRWGREGLKGLMAAIQSEAHQWFWPFGQAPNGLQT